MDALISRGNVYVDYGHQEGFHKAQRDYEHVLLREANNVDAHINLAYLYQISGKFMRAWNQFTTALGSNIGL
jgi:Tfp pilus assembly protein PilF